jgi:hypothetical protein
MRFKVPMTVTTKITVVWVKTLCNVVDISLKIEAAGYSQTLVPSDQTV